MCGALPDRVTTRSGKKGGSDRSSGGQGAVEERDPRGAFDGLLEKVGAYNPTYDRELLERAYGVAEKQHGSQLRASGEPYVSHPLGTALICADLRLDTPTLAAALLHRRRTR